jgi:hypothetical protein
MKMRIVWQEISDRVITDKNIKTTAVGKGFAEYEGNFNDEELVEFLNFLFNRKSDNKIKIVSVQIFGQ